MAFRCKGDCTVNGSIITHGKGSSRSDLFQLTHSKMIDRFLFGSGGGIFITCGGHFTAPSTARIGATWSGLGDNDNGAAGFGGSGSFAYESIANRNILTSNNKGLGGVGGGGGGSKYASYGYNSGSGIEPNISDSNRYDGYLGTGGGGKGVGNTKNRGYGGNGGTAGKNLNGGDYRTVASTYYANQLDASSAGGGGAGGDGGQGAEIKQTSVTLGSRCSAGACLILICKILDIQKETISTGGQGKNSIGSDRNNTNYHGGYGGGGTGFCYIACEEMI